MSENGEKWHPRAALLAARLALVGGLITLYAFLAMRGGEPVLLLRG